MIAVFLAEDDDLYTARFRTSDPLAERAIPLNTLRNLAVDHSPTNFVFTVSSCDHRGASVDLTCGVRWGQERYRAASTKKVGAGLIKRATCGSWVDVMPASPTAIVWVGCLPAGNLKLGRRQNPWHAPLAFTATTFP